MPVQIDMAVEEQALRDHGMIGRGTTMGNMLFAMSYDQLPDEAKHVIQLIINAGPFPYPQHDGHPFGNRFGDLPSGGEYFEFTVPTPNVTNRGARRIVARRNGVLFFTACHYERVQGPMSAQARRDQTALVDEQWRNGFYVITGLSSDMRQQIAAGIARIRARFLPAVIT